ncbi:MAG: gamma-glutamylcyclotransferase family protein [Tepidisphaeraceae bacterium]
MADHLFIYGTLLPGHVPAAMAAVCDRLRPIGRATIAGQLYDLGHYPGAVVGDGIIGGGIINGGTIAGEIVEIDGDDIWLALDRYEGCPRDGGGDGLFRRVRALATMHDGQRVECWVYVYQRDLSHARRITGGCWRAREQKG